MIKLDRNTLFGLSAVLLWSTSIALVRSIVEQLGPLTSGAFVYLMSGLLLWCRAFKKKGSAKKIFKLPRLYLFGCGALFAIYTVTIYIALALATNRSQTLEVAMVSYLWPIMSILFSLVLLSKKSSLVLIPSTLLALLGIFLVLTHGKDVSWSVFMANLMGNPTAYGLALVAAVSWALYSTLTRRWGDSSQEGAVPLFVLVTGMILLAIRLLFPEDSSYSLRLVIEVVCLSASIALAYTLWDISMRKGDVVLVLAFSYLLPFFSTVVSCIYLWVFPGARLWMGCLLVVVGSFLSWYSVKNSKQHSAGT